MGVCITCEHGSHNANLCFTFDQIKTKQNLFSRNFADLNFKDPRLVEGLRPGTTTWKRGEGKKKAQTATLASYWEPNTFPTRHRTWDKISWSCKLVVNTHDRG